MKNIVLIGFMGSGKTAVGRKLAKKIGWKFVDVDAEIVKSEGMSITKIFEKYGEVYFRRLETEAARKILDGSGKIVATGGGIVVKKRNIPVIKKRGVVAYLKNSFAESEKRLKGKKDRPLFRNINNARKLYKERLELYEKAADIKVLTDGKTVAAAAESVKKKLEAGFAGSKSKS